MGNSNNNFEKQLDKTVPDRERFIGFRNVWIIHYLSLKTYVMLIQ